MSRQYTSFSAKQMDAFLSLNLITTSPPSLSSMFLSNVAGFFGRMNALCSLHNTEKSLFLTSLCPSLATTARHSGVRSKYMPFICGLSSSCAVANRERLIFSASRLLEMVSSVYPSFILSVSGYVFASSVGMEKCPLRYIIFTMLELVSSSKVMGCSEKLFTASSMFLQLMAKVIEPSLSPTGRLVTMVFSLSEAVRNSVLSCISKRISAKMGVGDFTFITLARALSLLLSVVLEMVNLIVVLLLLLVSMYWRIR